MRVMGREYAKAKLRENKERLALVKKAIHDLKIPAEYPNRDHTQEFHD